MCQILQNKTHLNGKGRQWLWHNQQFRYFREYIRRQWHLHVLQKRQRHLQPLVQRHRSFLRKTRQSVKATRLARPHLWYFESIVTRWLDKFRCWPQFLFQGLRWGCEDDFWSSRMRLAFLRAAICWSKRPQTLGATLIMRKLVKVSFMKGYFIVCLFVCFIFT